jgi:energy-coupling factor transporter transmembrane protein EcfT
MEVMMYLTPILIVLAFIFYLIVFAVLKLPMQIFDLLQFLKISLVILIAWTFLVAMILFEDQVNQIDFSALKIGVLIYFAILPILVLGCMSANSCYFLMSKK